MFMWCSIKNRIAQACFLPPTSNADQIKNTQTLSRSGLLFHSSANERPWKVPAGSPSVANLCYLQPSFASSCIICWCEYVSDCDFGFFKRILLLSLLEIKVFCFFFTNPALLIHQGKSLSKLMMSENLRQLLMFRFAIQRRWSELCLHLTQSCVAICEYHG